MMDETEPENAGVDQATHRVSPSIMRHGSREDKGEGDDEREIPAVLPSDNLTLPEVTDISDTWLAPGFHEHPPNVRIPEAAVSVVRIEVGVGIAMMSAMATAPPLDGTLNSSGSGNSEGVLQ